MQAIRFLDSLEINLDVFWSALWKHVLLVEIIKHRYKVTSPATKANFLSNLRDRVKNDKTKQTALDYLDEFEGQFWCETDERVRDITDKLTDRLTSEAGFSLGSHGAEAKVGASGFSESQNETRVQQVDRFQRIVNEHQLARLNKMVDVLDDDILESPHDFRYVVIDDLDLEWVDERVANDLIRCLFQTVYSLQHVRNLKVLVALRTNIFQELDFGRKGHGQEEKLRALVLEVRWTKYDLEKLLNQRVRVAGPGAGLAVATFPELLPGTKNDSRDKPIDYILDRTLLRPRDAISFANECLSVGLGKARLSWADIKTAEKGYSSKRLLALRDEWKATFPGIEEVVNHFRGSPARIPRDDFSQRLDNIMLLSSNPGFEGVKWLTNASSGMWAAGPSATWSDMYHPLVKLLFSIGLIGVSSAGSAAPIFFNDDPLAVEQESSAEASRYFYVHRTYQAGLDVKASTERGR